MQIAPVTIVTGAGSGGMFLCIQEAFRQMKHQQPSDGRIINNGSTAAHKPRPHSIVYTATKHAVTGLTKAAALDGRTFDMACGQIDIETLGHRGVEEVKDSARYAKIVEWPTRCSTWRKTQNPDHKGSSTHPGQAGMKGLRSRALTAFVADDTALSLQQ